MAVLHFQMWLRTMYHWIAGSVPRLLRLLRCCSVMVLLVGVLMVKCWNLRFATREEVVCKMEERGELLNFAYYQGFLRLLCVYF